MLQLWKRELWERSASGIVKRPIWNRLATTGDGSGREFTGR